MLTPPSPYINLATGHSYRVTYTVSATLAAGAQFSAAINNDGSQVPASQTTVYNSAAIAALYSLSGTAIVQGLGAGTANALVIPLISSGTVTVTSVRVAINELN